MLVSSYQELRGKSPRNAVLKPHPRKNLFHEVAPLGNNAATTVVEVWRESGLGASVNSVVVVGERWFALGRV